jgi:serine O-acetyltransferase
MVSTLSRYSGAKFRLYVMNAIDLYRMGNKCFRKKIPLVPKIMYFLTFFMFNSVVPYTAKIGKDSKFAYGGMGVVVHSGAVIGERVVIGQGATIGRSLDPKDIPTIGNNVYISAGVRIIGKITVGNNVIIGANAVVNKDVPSNTIVAGVPAKVIRNVDRSIWDLLKNIY